MFQKLITCFIIVIIVLTSCGTSHHAQKDANNLFVYNDNVEARWSTPENRNGEKGNGGKENGQAKGHAFDSIAAGYSYSLLDIQGHGIINRIWITMKDRSPEMLRSLKIEMFWDNESKPAVSVPFGDFFGVGLGKPASLQNALFANPEGRSFICMIQMPFKKAAKIIITNESSKTLRSIFFDVDYNLLKYWNKDYMYFHAYWHRDTLTQLAHDFELLPAVSGKGRFIGVNVGVNANPIYKESWFGEGEVKMYIDGDSNFPTLNGTGAEDYIGTGWGEGKFINDYSGCTISNDTSLEYAFYRYHVKDPVYFRTGCKVTIQQIGGTSTNNVITYQKENLPVIPVTTDTGRIIHYYSKNSVTIINTSMPKGWTNFYRRDDYSSVAYFYLDKPTDNLPALQPLILRIANLKNK